MAAMVKPRPGGLFVGFWIRSKTSTSSPSNRALSGSTTIWLAIVWLFVPGSKMTRAASQLVPPFVVRENHVGPREANAFSNALVGGTSPGGGASRSHTAYAKLELLRSAVSVFLSLRMLGSSSRLSVIGSLHEAPPSVDRMTSIAFGEVPNPPGFVSTDSVIRYAVPFGEK